MVEHTVNNKFKIYPTNLKAEYLDDNSVVVAKGMLHKEGLLDYAKIHTGIYYMGHNEGNKSIITAIFQNTIDEQEIQIFGLSFCEAKELGYDEDAKTAYAIFEQ